MAHLPKRLWDSKKRAVRQGKQQVWEVNGELKLNGGNNWDGANPEEFEVYDKGVTEAQEPYATYDKNWEPIEPPTPPIVASFGPLFFFSKSYFENNGGIHQLQLTLGDTDGNWAMDIYYQYAYGSGNFINSWTSFYISDLGNQLAQLDWSWLNGQDEIVKNIFFNLGVFPMEGESMTYPISMSGTISNQVFIDAFNSLLTGNHETFYDLMSVLFASGSNIHLNIENYASTLVQIDVNNCGHLFSNNDQQYESYIEFDLTNHQIQPIGIYQLSYFYDYLWDEGQGTNTWQNKFTYELDSNKSRIINGTEYFVSDFWLWLWGYGVPSQSNAYNMSYLNGEMRYSWVDAMMHGNIRDPLDMLFQGAYGYTFENCPAVIRPSYNKSTAKYDSQNNMVYIGGRTDQNVDGEIRTFRGFTFEIFNGGNGVSVYDIYGGNPQAIHAIYSFLETLGTETLKQLINYDQMIQSDSTGIMNLDFFNNLVSFLTCGVPEGSAFSFDQNVYITERDNFINYLNDYIVNGNSFVYRNSNSIE